MTPTEAPDEQQLVLSDLLNHVLDKGVVITGDVTISVADIDLITLGLSVVLTAVGTLERRSEAGEHAAGGGRRSPPPALGSGPPPRP